MWFEDVAEEGRPLDQDIEPGSTFIWDEDGWGGRNDEP